MLLAIDVGNTHIVIGFIDDGRIVNQIRVHTNVNETAMEYAIKIKELLYISSLKPEDFEGAIMSSVVPPVTDALTEAVKLITGKECMVVKPGIKTGMNVRIDDPATLAGDLLVGGVAAIACYGAPAIVMDLGTATTVVAVDSSNSFVGGAIIPGVNLSYRALSSGASLLPAISIVPPKKSIATNTVDCMRSGAVFGTAAMLDGMIDRFERELGTKCKLIATGGLASSITPYCSHDIICDDDLLLKGLWVLYKKNK